MKNIRDVIEDLKMFDGSFTHGINEYIEVLEQTENEVLTLKHNQKNFMKLSSDLSSKLEKKDKAIAELKELISLCKSDYDEMLLKEMEALGLW